MMNSEEKDATSMRKVVLALNAAVVIFFGCFLAYTFVAREHLDDLARDFVTEKTLEHSAPIVEIADVAKESPLVRKLLSDSQIEAIQNELTEYRNDPAGYVSDLTRQQIREAPPANANPLLEEVASIKVKIRRFYDKTLNSLIRDLRIFSGSNLIAGVIALVLVVRSSTEIRKPIVWFSFLIFAAIFYCSHLYVDDLTFFRILFRTHMGWSYPSLLCGCTIAYYLEYGRHADGKAQGSI